MSLYVLEYHEAMFSLPESSIDPAEITASCIGKIAICDQLVDEKGMN